MSSQLSFDGSTQAEQELTARQAQALAIIRERGPIRSEDLGAEMYPRVHEFERARSFGHSVGEALAAKGLVRYVRGDGWVDANRAPEYSREYSPGDRYDPRTAEVPF